MAQREHAKYSYLDLSKSLTVNLPQWKTDHPEICLLHSSKNQNCSQTKQNFQKLLVSQLNETLLHKTRVPDF
jgi:hypothetical protein